MSGHTPGPWYIGEMYANTIAVKDKASGLVVAKASAMPSKIKEAEANAKLIASAPDVLAERDALRAVLREIINQVDRSKVSGSPVSYALIERAEKLLEQKQ